MFPARALGHFNERSLRCDRRRALRVFASFGKTFVLFMLRDLRNNQMSVASNRTEQIGLGCYVSGQASGVFWVLTPRQTKPGF